MTMKKRRSSSDDILEENFVQNTKIRLSDIYTKLSLIDGRLRSFEDSNHKIMDKIAILESSVQILETYAVNAAVVGRNGSIALNGNKNLSSSMTSLLQPLTESDDEGTENSESVSTPTALTYEESLSISRSQSFTDIPKLYNNNHHAPISHHKSSPPPITPQFIPPSPSPSIKNSVKFRDKPSAISGITKSRTVGASDSRFSWSGTTSFSKQEKVEYIKTGPLEVKKRFTGYKLYWCCLKSDLSLLLFSYPEHLRQPDCPVRHRPKYTMRLRGCYCVLRDVNEKNGYEEDPSQKVGRFDFIRIDNNSIYNQFAATSYHEAKDWVDTFENVALTMATENGLRKKHQRRISAQSLNDLHILKRSSLDSPAGSLQEMVSSSNPNSNLSTSSRGGGSNNGSGGGVPPPPPPPLPPSDSSITSSNHNSQHPPFWDSDFETEPDPPDWRFSMNQEDLVKLKPKEKKRQDVINEFFHTERSHVRNLKNMIMKDRIKSQGFPIGDISDLFLEMFDGPNGDSLIELGSEFTQNQKFTIEELKKKRARDHKFDAFLSDLERRPECRRLGLESILPVEHQRLDSSYSTIKNCVERTKFILDSIDKRVAEAQNLQRLAEIQKNLDTSGLEKNPESSIPAEYKNCDLTKHRLIYDGPLTLKLGDTRRFKTVDLHVVLLEDCIMLLQKQDDKYLLKFHTSGAASSTGDKKFFHSPIIEFSTMLVRPVATDKRAFYLLNITQTVPQIYELVASSSADRSHVVNEFMPVLQFFFVFLRGARILLLQMSVPSHFDREDVRRFSFGCLEKSVSSSSTTSSPLLKRGRFGGILSASNSREDLTRSNSYSSLKQGIRKKIQVLRSGSFSGEEKIHNDSAKPPAPVSRHSPSSKNGEGRVVNRIRSRSGSNKFRDALDLPKRRESSNKSPVHLYRNEGPAGSSSLTRIASRASDIQSYASKYIDTLRSWRKTPPPLPTVLPRSSTREEGYCSQIGCTQDHRWFRHITEASNAYRARDNRRNFRTTGGISPLPDTGSNNNNRETSSTNGLTSSTSVDNTRKDSSSLLGVKGILPAGRSHSFHESSSSSRESPPERQPSSPPEDITKGDCSVNEGAGGGSGSTTPRKRLQRVEILKIAEPSPLIDPSQVVVTQGEILVADPVLTPIEKLRPDIFQIPTDDFDAIADIASQPSQNKDAREVLLAALAQANSLSELLNESLNLTEEDTIAASSQFKSPPISMSFLTSLLAIFQMREEERDRSRHCLQRYQDQIDVYLSDSTTCPVVRPVSFISVEENSSGIQDSEEDEEKRAEKSQSTNQSVSLDIAANVEGVLVSESSNPNSGERALLEDSIDRKFQIEEEEAEGGNESDGSLSPQEGEGVRLLPETNDVVIKTEDEDHTKCLTNPAMEETSSSTGDSPKNETEQSDEP
ncbi:ARHGEF12 [Lepeophtheirus salmonis]|uniref:ARHGEF12 n=1 Tax=Lepeophtheirus salmonis TaxID=72036 RepID=A0A7R8CVV1_LEPSM|nr:ARHGEF12 [Lepeophtheirus salmonis]CAF2946636.1 ARHGEF12 [Lepeophtheirus salmonis]